MNGVSLALNATSALTSEWFPPAAMAANVLGLFWSVGTRDSVGTVSGGSQWLGYGTSQVAKTEASIGLKAVLKAAGQGLNVAGSAYGAYSSAKSIADDLTSGCEEKCKDVQ